MCIRDSHAGDSHGISNDRYQFTGQWGSFGKWKNSDSADRFFVFNAKDGEIGGRRSLGRSQTNRGRRSGEKNNQTFEHCRRPALYEIFRLTISIPGLGHVAVGGKQAITNEESGPGDACANGRRLIRESDLVYAVNVSDGIAIAIEHESRHGLLLLELRHLLRCV